MRANHLLLSGLVRLSESIQRQVHLLIDQSAQSVAPVKFKQVLEQPVAWEQQQRDTLWLLPRHSSSQAKSRHTNGNWPNVCNHQAMFS